MTKALPLATLCCLTLLSVAIAAPVTADQSMNASGENRSQSSRSQNNHSQLGPLGYPGVDADDLPPSAIDKARERERQSSAGPSSEDMFRAAEQQQRQGNIKNALRLYGAVLAKQPYNRAAMQQSIPLFSQIGLHQQAANRHLSLLKLDRDSPELMNEQARLEQAAGNHVVAATRWHALLKRVPGYHDARNSLAQLLLNPALDTYAPQEALTLASELNILSQNNAAYLDTLAAAQHANGRSSEAAKTAKRAATLARRAEQPELAQSISQQLTTYELAATSRR